MSLTESLEILSKIAPIISASTAVIAAIFISRQIINIRRNREVDTLFKIITLSDSERMLEAKDWFIYELDENLTVKSLKADKEAMKNFSHIVHLFETMGVLVNNGYIPESLVFDKYGLFIIGSWRRLQHLIAAMRINLQSYEYAENFEELVSRYDNWAATHALKTVKGTRMSLREAGSFLNYKGEGNERDSQGRTGSDK